ncbi:MAG TPA: FAD/NAD(P)-binding oxidoreductase [Acidimicrobiales bacterium]|nr:FAD/NAD(P)-binding oxidoreductase [Acidimicrobiales bacterium]
MSMDRIVVAGASLGGLRTAEALRHEGFAGELIVIGAEHHFPPYDRPPFSKEILKGEWEADRGRLKVIEHLNAELVLGRRIVKLHHALSEVELDDGSRISFDGLVIATGASPRMLASIDASTPGVFVLRTYDESVALREALAKSPKVAIIGAGWIGCEVAATCRGYGLDVTLIEYFPQPLERTLGPVMGEWAAEVHRRHGVDLRLGVGVKGISGQGAVERVELEDGSFVEADVVVLAVGVAPETSWLEGNDFDLENGVLCDETLLVKGANNVVAVGDVVRWPNAMFNKVMRVEHWSNAVEQASVAAHTLLHGPSEAKSYVAVPYVWSDQYDLKIQYVGTAGAFHSVFEGSIEDNKFVAGYEADGMLVGALCVNSPARMIKYKRFISTHPQIEDISANLP